MADYRNHLLPDKINLTSLADLTGLYFQTDKTGFSQSKGFEASDLLTSSVVSANTVDYKAMTPKAFYDSTATTTRKGIVNTASDSDVTDKTGSGLVASGQQGLMQTQWKKDWFNIRGVPEIVYEDNEAMAFMANYKVDLLNPYQSIQLTPTLDSGKKLANGIIQLVVAAGQTVAQGTYNIPVQSVGSEQYIEIDNLLRLVIDSNRQYLSLSAKSLPLTALRLSVTLNLLLDYV